MASFYELTEEEVIFLLEALEYFKTHQGTYGADEYQLYSDLVYYLKENKRR